jgi:hypothetical protein
MKATLGLPERTDECNPLDFQREQMKATLWTSRENKPATSFVTNYADPKFSVYF